ncbi:hypothetical protein GH733_017788, partial [Mirounga leonina]
MPGLNEILSDPEVLAAMQDPEVMVAFQDAAQNPANMSKYQSNPKVMNLISKLLAKFGGKVKSDPKENSGISRAASPTTGLEEGGNVSPLQSR